MCNAPCVIEGIANLQVEVAARKIEAMKRFAELKSICRDIRKIFQRRGIVIDNEMGIFDNFN